MNYIKRVRMGIPITEETYLTDIPSVRYLMQGNSLEFQNKITFLVGENGTGKSTLIEGIAVAYGFNPEGGGKNFNFSTNNSHSELYNHLILSKGVPPKDGFFLRAESVYNVASHIDEIDSIPAAAPPVIDGYGGVSLHKQSHGESFMAIVKNRFRGNGIYILDEPEAALSPAKLLELMVNVKKLADCNSQFIIATHSPILMAFPGADILQLSERGIEKTEYKDTEHYRITKNFLDCPERMLDIMFE